MHSNVLNPKLAFSGKFLRQGRCLVGRGFNRDITYFMEIGLQPLKQGSPLCRFCGKLLLHPRILFCH